MGWMRRPEEPQPETKPPEPFHVDITDEEYMKLPWTVQLVDGKWHCAELDVTARDAQAFDLLCATECRMQLSRAVDGARPALPTGYRWKDGRPARDPGERYTNLRRF